MKKNEFKILITRVTPKGEICWDGAKGEFVVFDETSAYEVGRTTLLEEAYEILETYIGGLYE